MQVEEQGSNTNMVAFEFRSIKNYDTLKDKN